MSVPDNSSSPVKLKWWGMTHPGRFRKNNEDSFLALTINANEVNFLGKEGDATLDRGDFAFAVSDGMGGAKSGEFASSIAVQKITELLPKSFKLAASGMDSGCKDVLEELFQRIHKEMTDMGFHYEECRGMGATLSLTWFMPERMYFCHIGDSRIYYLPQEGGIKQITHDHTDVAAQFRAGKLSEREARNHPRRNILQQVLGGRVGTISPQVGAVAYQSGDRFIICSDGIIDGVRDHRLESLTRDPVPRFKEMNPAHRLVQDSMEESGRDNLTALVVEVG
ncbi:protein phosphatase 2C domain-containing protein [Puniceicoccaceae bacterium K14]|nr:protein phosphatase 2C domain-containing protein [Puniceicoccaceae bacterium K14]